MAKGVLHYFRDGTKHSGGMHKMPNGELHSGARHTKNSKKLPRNGYEVGKNCANSSLALIEKIGCIILQEA